MLGFREVRIRRFRLSTILTLLVLATALPLALFAGWVIWSSWTQRQALIDQQNIDQAHAIQVAVDQEVERTIAALDVLALLDPIDAPDRRQFSEIAARTLPLHPGWRSIRLIDPSLRVLSDTEHLRDVGRLLKPEWVLQIVRTQQPAVSTVRQEPRSKQWVLSIGVPVMRGGALKYVLGVRILAREFSNILVRQQTPPGAVVTLVDAEPKIIARTLNEDKYVGASPTRDFVSRSRAAPEGAWRSMTLEGTRSYAAWSRSERTGWTIGIGFPADAVDGPSRRSFAALLAAGIATLGGGVVLALLLSRGVVRTQAAAAEAARALARGEPLPAFRSNVVEAQELAAQLQEAAVILQTRLRERDEAQQELDRQRAALLEREQAARRAAEAVSRAKDEFVATVSHELRTPLNAIFGWVALLRSETLDPARQAHALEIIDRNTRAQARLIEDLLDMSRVIRGDVRLAMHPVDLAGVLEAAVDSLKPTASARHIDIAISAGPGVVVAGDYSRLQQILWNLLANSLKFTPPGGRIRASVSIADGEAVVAVSDTGEGISPQFLPHVFDRFRQETADVTRTHSGLGIGLSLVRHLTELHGGTIRAESDGKGRGATFTLRLPLVGTPTATATPAARDQAGARSPDSVAGLHVLVVDDEADARDLVATALEQHGAHVTMAGSAQEARLALGRDDINIVVSDIAMPDETGYDLAYAVRADPRTAALPLVAMTAYSRDEDRTRAIAAGFNAHLGKPFDPQILVALVASLAAG